MKKLTYVLMSVLLYSCNGHFQEKQDYLTHVLDKKDIRAFWFQYSGNELLYTLDDILDQKYLTNSEYKSNPIEVNQVVRFFETESNFYVPKSECTTFLISEGIVIELEGQIAQIIFSACSSNKLICIENGKFTSYYLTQVGQANFENLKRINF